MIVGGCCALVAIMRHLGLDSIVHSESDILDGLALSALSGTWGLPGQAQSRKRRLERLPCGQVGDGDRGEAGPELGLELLPEVAR